MKRILVVDDDADFRESLVHMLTRQGFSVTEAVSGPAALRLAGEQSFDVVLLDLILPEMDGIEPLEALKKVRPSLKFIMVTAFATIDNAVSAIKQGASDYIAKPFQVEHLVATIERLLDEANFEEEIRVHNLDQAMIALSNPIRRSIVELLANKQPLRLMEMTKDLNMRDHTKLLFHLRSLRSSGIIRQDPNKAYHLTETGRTLLIGLDELKMKLDRTS